LSLEGLQNRLQVLLLPLQAIEEDYAKSQGNLNEAKNKPDPDIQLGSKLTMQFAQCVLLEDAHGHWTVRERVSAMIAWCFGLSPAITTPPPLYHVDLNNPACTMQTPS